MVSKRSSDEPQASGRRTSTPPGTVPCGGAVGPAAPRSRAGQHLGHPLDRPASAADLDERADDGADHVAEKAVARDLVDDQRRTRSGEHRRARLTMRDENTSRSVDRVAPPAALKRGEVVRPFEETGGRRPCASTSSALRHVPRVTRARTGSARRRSRCDTGRSWRASNRAWNSGAPRRASTRTASGSRAFSARISAPRRSCAGAKRWRPVRARARRRRCVRRR